MDEGGPPSAHRASDTERLLANADDLKKDEDDVGAGSMSGPRSGRQGDVGGQSEGVPGTEDPSPLTTEDTEHLIAKEDALDQVKEDVPEDRSRDGGDGSEKGGDSGEEGGKEEGKDEDNVVSVGYEKDPSLVETIPTEGDEEKMGNSTGAKEFEDREKGAEDAVVRSVADGVLDLGAPLMDNHRHSEDKVKSEEDREALRKDSTESDEETDKLLSVEDGEKEGKEEVLMKEKREEEASRKRTERGGGGDVKSDLSDSYVNVSMSEDHHRHSKYTGVKTMIPLRCEKAPQGELPLSSNGLLTTMTFGWLTGHMWDVYKHGLTNVQSLRMGAQDSSQCNAVRLERLWKEEVSSKGPQGSSFARVVMRSFRTRLLIGALISLLDAFLILANPMLVIRYFLEYLVEEDVSLSSGVGYIFLLALVIILGTLTQGVFWAINFQAAARIKYGSLAMLYKKVTKLKTLGDKTVGDMVNYISNDGQRLWDAVIMGPFIIRGPMILVMSCVYSLVYMGPWALLAWLVIIGFYPFMMSFAKMSQKYREQSIVVTDKRVGLMSELLTSVKLVKMYAWEQLYSQRIKEVRGEERAILEKSDLVLSLGMGSSMLVPIFASCLTFIGYVASGNNLSPIQAFTFMSLLNAMQSSSASIPFALKSIAEMMVSAQRMKDVLLLEELQYDYSPPSASHTALEVSGASFSWSQSLSQSTGDLINNGIHPNNDKEKLKESGNLEEKKKLKDDEESNTSIFTGPSLHNISFTVKKGQLVGVCGHVGGGKTSLLQALLGRMSLESGQVTLQSGPVAYVPQQPWVMNDTLRGNVLLGREFLPDLYNQVIEACGLTEDIAGFPSGDFTEVGERGVTLSGGQKQRLSLARAVYSQSDLLLLDDPLSAVDSQLALHIFQHCLRGLLKDRTLLLVTHQIQFLQHCDHILVVQEGRLSEQGSHQNLVGKGGEYANLLTHLATSTLRGGEGETSRDNTANTVIIQPKDEGETASKGEQSASKGDIHHGQLVAEEEMGYGALQWSVVQQYILAMGGYPFAALVMVCFSLPVIGVTMASWFLSYWLEQGGGSATMTVGPNQTVVPSPRVVDNPDKDTYLAIYAMFIPLLILVTFLRSLSLVKSTVGASTQLHNSGFIRILAAPMALFDATPVGRMLNRFSADQDECDTRLPMNLEIFLTNSLQILAALGMIAYVSPWFLIAVVPLGFVFLFLMAVFHRCIREIKRWDNVSRSPVLSHMGTTVHGLSSIQAYRKVDSFIARHCELLNQNCVAVFLFYATNRWLAIRLDFIAAAVTFVTGFLILVTFDLMNPAMAGLGLSFCIQMSGLFQFMARMAVETEARFTSVERILNYCNIQDQERATVKEKAKSTEGWPSSGAITFDNVQLRYRSGLPLALKGVSFSVQPKQKIGIVGRSGAGKSSLTLALFRLVELEGGHITLDDLDIASVPLAELRSRLSIIPQEPVLFSGTLRSNLDPVTQFSDAEIWQALDRCHVTDLVRNSDHQLDTVVQENGDNFSVGQRQLLCMARALLRNSKVLVLDEATASIDPETDTLIQKTLRESFKDCSMLFIAHRINTVISCDQILVLEDGQVQEFDSPTSLLSQPNSKFKAMLEAGDGTQPS